MSAQPLPTGPFNLIYADPPWTYRDKCHAGKRGAGYKYPTMAVHEIAALPVPEITAPDCLLAMWWVGPQPAEALQVVDAWGFTLVNLLGFVWRKTTKHNREQFGMGNWTRANAECVLFAKKGKPKRIDAGVRQFVHAEVREHSRKPDEVRDSLVRLVGDVPRVELFVRERMPGWEAWGDGLFNTESTDHRLAHLDSKSVDQPSHDRREISQ